MNTTGYSCSRCYAPATVAEGVGVLRSCECGEPVIGHMQAHATGISKTGRATPYARLLAALSLIGSALRPAR